MRIIYFYFFTGLKSGIEKKIHSQISSLRELGIDCQLLLVGKIPQKFLSTPFISIIQVNGCLKFNWVCRLIRSIKIAAIIQNYSQSLDQKDYFYTRYPLPFLCYPKFIFKKYRSFKLVYEYNTIESREFALVHRYVQYLSDFFLGKLFREQSDAIVGVTDEITHYELERSGTPNKPHITIGNGFDVNSVPVRDTKPYSSKELHLLCVANVSKWHGLDRLLMGLAKYRGNTRIFFHIAGDGAEITFLKQMVDKLNIQELVIFHGFATGDDLDTLFNTCHIAVGSLGIHRLGLHEASILKAREYCARGIPYIIAYADPDFPDDFPYIHKLPPDESLVDLERINTFAQKICSDPDHPQKMREYALEHLDWDVKMKKLKIFLETLVGETDSIV